MDDKVKMETSTEAFKQIAAMMAAGTPAYQKLQEENYELRHENGMLKGENSQLKEEMQKMIEAMKAKDEELLNYRDLANQKLGALAMLILSCGKLKNFLRKVRETNLLTFAHTLLLTSLNDNDDETARHLIEDVTALPEPEEVNHYDISGNYIENQHITNENVRKQ